VKLQRSNYLANVRSKLSVLFNVGLLKRRCYFEIEKKARPPKSWWSYQKKSKVLEGENIFPSDHAESTEPSVGKKE
jgi:hypothetical protein